MNVKIIEENYQKLMKKNNGCRLYKMDLHIHTPASKCYKRCVQDEKEEYIRILEQLRENNISIAAITDHNSVKGFFELQKILQSDWQLKNKYKDILILPGVEISNFGKHVLAIFPETKDKAALDSFLYNIGIDVNEQGEESADAYKVTPINLLKEISQNDGLAILAHADSNNGLLQKILHNQNRNRSDKGTVDQCTVEWINSGKSLAQIIQSPYLKGISINQASLKEVLIRKVLRNKEYKRQTSLPILFCSDSHSTGGKVKKADGVPIGERFSYIKLSHLSFEGVKLALEDPDVRIYDDDTKREVPNILGIAIHGGYLGKSAEYEVFRFNRELNCIIGARGTGKSTLLDIIQYTLCPKEELKEVAEKFISAIVYLEYENRVYAIACKPQIQVNSYTGEKYDISSRANIYIQNSRGRFNTKKEEGKKILTEVSKFTSVSYRQKDIYKYTLDIDGPKNIIDNLLIMTKHDAYLEVLKKLEIQKKLLNENIKEIDSQSQKRQEIKQYLRDSINRDGDYERLLEKPYLEILDYIQEMSELRKGLVNEINRILQGKLVINIFTKCQYEQLIETIITRYRQTANIPYEKQLQLKKELETIVAIAKKDNNYKLWNYIFHNRRDSLINEYNLPEEKVDMLIEIIRKNMYVWDLLVFPEDKVEFAYNVNEGISKKEKFVERSKLSMGQRAVAMLLVILKAGYELGDNRPLIIDQPEDDLDNVYIYSTLVKEFREIKKSRQLIFATHNSNIPIAGDAENIMLMKSDGENGYLDQQGSIDKESMREMVLKILEGGDRALLLRISKYASVLYPNKNKTV